MNIVRFPKKEDYAKICERPHLDVSQLNATVSAVLSDITERGDAAVKDYEAKFDKVQLDSLVVSAELMSALVLAHKDIAAFHESQRFVGKKVETASGVTCWQ